MSELKSKRPVLLIRFDQPRNNKDIFFVSKSMSDGEIYKGLRKYFLRRDYNDGIDFNNLTLKEDTDILSKKLKEYGLPFFVFCFERKHHCKGIAH